MNTKQAETYNRLVTLANKAYDDGDIDIAQAYDNKAMVVADSPGSFMGDFD